MRPEQLTFDEFKNLYVKDYLGTITGFMDDDLKNFRISDIRLFDYKNKFIITDYYIFAIDQNLKSIGYISFNRRIKQNDELIINTIFVKKEFRGKGIPYKMLDYLRKMGKNIRHSSSLSIDGVKFAYRDYLNQAIKKRKKIPFDVLELADKKIKKTNRVIMSSKENYKLAIEKIKFFKRKSYNLCYLEQFQNFLDLFFNSKKILKYHKNKFREFLKQFLSKIACYNPKLKLILKSI